MLQTSYTLRESHRTHRRAAGVLQRGRTSVDGRGRRGTRHLHRWTPVDVHRPSAELYGSEGRGSPQRDSQTDGRAGGRWRTALDRRGVAEVGELHRRTAVDVPGRSRSNYGTEGSPRRVRPAHCHLRERDPGGLGRAHDANGEGPFVTTIRDARERTDIPKPPASDGRRMGATYSSEASDDHMRPHVREAETHTTPGFTHTPPRRTRAGGRLLTGEFRVRVPDGPPVSASATCTFIS